MMDRLEEIEERFIDASMSDMPINAKLRRKLHLAEIDIPWLIMEITTLKRELEEARDTLAEIAYRCANSEDYDPVNIEIGAIAKSKCGREMKYYCPKCGKELERTETDGLWCSNNCYESEFHLWKALCRRFDK